LDWAFKEQEGQELLRRLHDAPNEPISLDTETTGLKVWDGQDHVIGASIAGLVDGEPFSHYFPLAHPAGDEISTKTRDMLHYVLAQEGRELILANAQFDMAGLLWAGIDLREQYIYDIGTMSRLADENALGMQKYSLDNLAKHWAGAEKIEDPFVEAEMKSGNQTITAEQMWLYACTDAEVTYATWLNIIEHPEWVLLRETTDVWDVKQRLIKILMEMRIRGVRLDPELASEMATLGRAKMAELREAMGFNPGSNKQLAEVLIDTLGLPVLKRSGKTNAPSFSKDVMPEYDELLEATDNPLAKQLLEYRGWQKAVTASYEPYLQFVSTIDGRIHGGFNTQATVTGRLSSSEPNMQQIPKESVKPWNGRVKECFIAKPGFVLLSADYSQLELRLAAAYSQETKILEVFNDPSRDVFTEMSHDLNFSRDDTKKFVYTVQYGGGVKSIRKSFRVDAKTALQMRANFYATYPQFRAFNESCQMKAERYLKAKLWSGRYRHFKYRNDGYKAMNSVLQGGGADVVERVMVRVFDELDSEDCQMLLQVHDALVFEVREELAEEYAPRIKALMEDVNGAIGKELFNVRFNVEVTPWSGK
jgi:DNA polymerase-1